MFVQPRIEAAGFRYVVWAGSERAGFVEPFFRADRDADEPSYWVAFDADGVCVKERSGTHIRFDSPRHAAEGLMSVVEERRRAASRKGFSFAFARAAVR